MSASVKHPITSRITGRLVILFVAVLACVFTGSYHIVSRIITEESGRYTQALCSIFSDLITYGISDVKSSYADISTDDMHRVGDYICTWYSIDYAYAYTPHVEDGTVTIRFVCAKDGSEEYPTDITDETVRYVFEEDELAIYRDNTRFLFSNNRFFPTVSEVRLAVTDADDTLMVFGVGTAGARLHQMVWDRYWPFALVIGLVLLIMAGVIYFIIRHSVLKPAIQLSGAMESFIRDGRRGEKLPETGRGDEFAMIARAFNGMYDDIDSYLEDIRGLTQQQEQQRTAMNIAGSIQQSFLQSGSFSSPHCEIHAMMSPASDIGGDLYDYMILDEDRMLLTIADVSGKGVAASMFMAAALILMRQLARTGSSPAQILESTNKSISERNTRMLFITAFVAVYNHKTGVLTYANAGHDVPYVLHGRDSIRTLEDAKGVVLGLFPEERYSDAEERMQIGDILFLYTDGVNEANNVRREFFGNERIEETLRLFASSHEENPVAHMEKSVRSFIGECEQHDDMTMLSMTVKESGSLFLPVRIDAFEQIRSLILQTALPMSLRMDLCLAAEEIFVNICSYAYPSPATENDHIRFELEISDRVLIRFTDHGVPYDPTRQVISPEDYDLSVGGLGRLIAFNISDKVSYAYENDQNVLTMIKYMKEDPHDHPTDK